MKLKLNSLLLNNSTNTEVIRHSGKEVFDKKEVILKLPNISSGVMYCKESRIGFVQKLNVNKNYSEEYTMRYQGNLCPMSLYKTTICIIDVYCLQSQIISKAPFYQIISTNNVNLQRFVLEEYKGMKEHWFYIDFYSLIDPIQIEFVEKFIVIDKFNVFIEEHFNKIKNVGNEINGPFERVVYQQNGNESICLKKVSFKLPLGSVVNKYYDSTGLISGYSQRESKKSTVVTIEPRYPLFGGWSTSVSLDYKSPLQENKNVIAIPLVTNSIAPIGVIEYNCTVVLPVGMNVKNYWFNTSVTGIASQIIQQPRLAGLFYSQTIEVKLNNIALDQNELYLMVEYSTTSTYYEYIERALPAILIIVLITIINYVTL